jgi:hypothetical protein
VLHGLPRLRVDASLKPAIHTAKSSKGVGGRRKQAWGEGGKKGVEYNII